MHALTLIHGVGSIGFFSSRAFLPAFVTCLLLRFGPEAGFLADTGLFEHVVGTPTWFTHDLTVVILGLLSLLEVGATKSPEARQILDEIDRYLKPAMAVATVAGVLSATDASFVERAIVEAGAGDYLFTAIVAVGVYFMSTVRSRVLGIFSEADEDDDVGVQGLISWGEDLWVVAGLFLLFVFPIVMLILIGIAAALLLLARKIAEVREEKSKVACGNCKELVYGCAIACPHCGQKVASPRRVGFLGQTKDDPADDLSVHPYRLVEKKRCPVCATRFGRRAVKQKCDACGHELMAEKDFAHRYLDYVGSRVARVGVVCALLSLIPVIGLVPGVIYYRMALVAPFRRYLPMGRRFLIKWLVRIVIFILIAFQWIPLLGALVVPVMALLSYTAYRSSYKALALG